MTYDLNKHFTGKDSNVEIGTAAHNRRIMAISMIMALGLPKLIRSRIK